MFQLTHKDGSLDPLCQWIPHLEQADMITAKCNTSSTQTCKAVKVNPRASWLLPLATLFSLRDSNQCKAAMCWRQNSTNLWWKPQDRASCCYEWHLMNDFFYLSLWALTELLQVVCDDSAFTRLRKRVTILVRTTDLEISDCAQSHGFFSPAVWSWCQDSGNVWCPWGLERAMELYYQSARQSWYVGGRTNEVP